MTQSDLPSPLVGRTEELAFVQAVAKAPGAAGVVVSGPAGIGKTAFAGHAAGLRGNEAPGEWIQGSHAAEGILLGPFAHLLDGGRPDATVAALVGALAHDLRQRAATRPFTMVVDDAHLLDGASLTALGAALGAPGLFVIVTVRSGEPGADAMASFDLPRLVLQPLALDEVGRLATTMLAAPVDEATTREMHRVTGGNPLFLRELVRGEREAGRLRAGEGGAGWRWRSDPDSVTSLAEVVSRRIGTLSSDEQRALALLAYGGPLELPMLDHLVEPAILATLEARDLVMTERDGRRTAVRIAHPLYEEHLRASTRPLRVRQLCGELLAALAEMPGRRRADRLRDSLWRLERGDAIAADTLMAATLNAQQSFHISVVHALTGTNADGGPVDRTDQRIEELVERFDREGKREAAQAYQLALAAWDRSPSVDTGLAVVTLQFDGVVPDRIITRVLDQVDQLAVTPTDRRRWALEQATAQLWRGRDPAAAFATLDTTAAALDQPDDRAIVVAVRAGLALHTGDAVTARLLGGEVRLDESLSPYPRVVAAVPFSGGLCLSGQFDAGLRVIDEAVPEVFEHALEDPRVIGDLMFGKVAGLVGAGRLTEAAETADGVFQLALEHGSLHGVGQFGGWFGIIALQRGHVAEAIRQLQRADGLLAGNDSIGARSHLLANLASAYALAGHPGPARDRLEQARAIHVIPRFFDADLAVADAWIAAAEGEAHRGAALALAGAERAYERGCLAYALPAADVAARLGAPGAEDLLAALVPHVDGPLGPLWLARCRAARDPDPVALDRVAVDCEALGLDLHAAEAAALAAAQWRGAGDAERAAASAARVPLALDRCVGVAPPTLVAEASVLDALTKREREVVELARQGLSSPAIAEQLFLSTRTVETHLYRSFTKLGVSRRAELAALLSAPPGPRP